MAGEIHGLGPRREPMERGHVIAHGPVRRRDDRGRPAHHVIAGEQHLGALERVGHVIGGVAGRRHRFKRPAVARDDVPMRNAMVGHERGIAAGVEPARLTEVQRTRRPVRPLCESRRAGRRLDGGGAGGVVAMRMGDDDMRHALATHGIEQRCPMRRVVRTGIDDRHLAAADDIAQRPLEGERPRIVREDPPHSGYHLVDGAGREVENPIEGDCVGHAGLGGDMTEKPGRVGRSLYRIRALVASAEGRRRFPRRYPPWRLLGKDRVRPQALDYDVERSLRRSQIASISACSSVPTECDTFACVIS